MAKKVELQSGQSVLGYVVLLAVLFAGIIFGLYGMKDTVEQSVYKHGVGDVIFRKTRMDFVGREAPHREEGNRKYGNNQ